MSFWAYWIVFALTFHSLLGIVFTLTDEASVTGPPTLVAWSEGEWNWNENWNFYGLDGKRGNLDYPFNLSEGDTIWIAGELRDEAGDFKPLYSAIKYNIRIKLWDATSGKTRAEKEFDWSYPDWTDMWGGEYRMIRFNFSGDFTHWSDPGTHYISEPDLVMPYHDLYFTVEVTEIHLWGEDQPKEGYGGVIYGESSYEGDLFTHELEHDDFAGFWRAIQGFSKSFTFAFDAPHPFNMFLTIIVVAIDGLAVYAVIYHVRPGWWLFGGG